jgi:DUF1009 family protein
MTDGRPTSGRTGPLGILACAGPLPIEVAGAAARQGRAVHVVAIDGFAGEWVKRFSHEQVSIGEVGRILASFRRAGVREIVIAGAMQRPNLLKIKIDSGFVLNLPTVLALTKGGDDSVLRRIVRFFEGHGLTVVGAGDVAPELLAPTGTLTKAPPSAEARLALERAAALIRALGPFDIGQGVVASHAGIIAVEGLRGTDAMLRDLGPDGVGEGLGAGGVLVKLAKPGQEMRIDLPTVGPETVRKAKAAGLAGLAIGAGAAIVLERPRLVAEAEAAGLFVVGLEDQPARATPSVQVGAGPIDATPGATTTPFLRVAARRAPTPGDRRDIGIGRDLVGVLRQHGAGPGVIVAREHVLAVSGQLPLAPFVAAQGRSASWGWRALKRRIGVLVVDVASLGREKTVQALDAPLLRACMESGLAGIVLLGPLPEGEHGEQVQAWANEARLFLMAEEVGS